MSRIPGVVPAIVKSVSDPDNLGRVQVNFDWLDDAPDSHWARVASPMAGGERGCFFMPEIGDEVLVAFERGHVDFPYVVGYCWSSPDKPPFGANLEKRGIKTVAGSELIFDDNPGASPTITLTTRGGFKVLLDESGAKITIATGGGTTIELDDRPPQVQVHLPTGNALTLGPAGLDINVAAGQLTVEALSVTVTAPTVTIDAAMTTVSGVLTVAGPVIANGIVSPTYTPGAGNIW
ncbi:MAG: phage baseplate assembly protein V [Candidatus Velthaea sp.]